MIVDLKIHDCKKITAEIDRYASISKMVYREHVCKHIWSEYITIVCENEVI